ncbi:ankyrin repeat domain-containing protein 23 [Penaeus vannamei]|uniref:ankyrin repeat domain-containing protein 23 n=1 Tax=Penaeus vannamei TaxID=6689 RepID=UPI00387F7E07
MYATIAGNLEVMRELLSVGADVEVTDEEERTALIYSIVNKQTKAAKTLLAYGADINGRGIDGDTVLIEAIKQGQEAMVEVLLQHCPDMSLENINRKTAFTIARERSNKNIRAMIEAHESMTCSDNGLAYILGSVKYDSCRQQLCCHGIWRNTGLALASCGTPCNTPGTRLGTCVLVGECVRLEQVFLVTNAAGDVARTTKFLVDHRCDTREGSVYVCCPKA